MNPFRSLLPLAVLAAASPLSADINYHLARTLAIGGEGAWDYVTVDAGDGLLFLPRASHTQVVEAASGKVIADIPGQKHNHGVALVPAAGRGFISDGEDGSVHIFDLKTYQLLGKVKAADDADGIIYDPSSNKVFVVCGDSACVIPISPDVDPINGHADPSIDLGGKPEFLASDGKGRLYINLEDKDQLAVVDTREMRVVAKWPVAPGGHPVGLAIDRKNGRLFIGCRNPQKLVVMSTAGGKVLGDVAIGAGVDACGFDSGLAFASCRDGTLTVAREDGGAWVDAQTVRTKPGARTLGIDPRSHTIYLPTAAYAPGAAGRPAVMPGSFMVLAVRRAGQP
ncbi:MAG TPA: hypothetical protein VHC86_00770 [Opitutaceae bacterium]|nr:hypothetical protein [Opitutaceae bacterium]